MLCWSHPRTKNTMTICRAAPRRGRVKRVSKPSPSESNAGREVDCRSEVDVRNRLCLGLPTERESAGCRLPVDLHIGACFRATMGDFPSFQKILTLKPAVVPMAQ